MVSLAVMSQFATSSGIKLEPNVVRELNLISSEDAQIYVSSIANTLKEMDGEYVYLISDNKTDTSEELFTEIDTALSGNNGISETTLFKIISTLHQLGHTIRIWDAGKGDLAHLQVLNCENIEIFLHNIKKQASKSSYNLRMPANNSLKRDVLKHAP